MLDLVGHRSRAARMTEARSITPATQRGYSPVWRLHCRSKTRIGPQLAATLQNKIPGLKPLQRCQITKVFYTGDEGGIVCSLDLPGGAGKEVYLASITHLVFVPDCLWRGG